MLLLVLNETIDQLGMANGVCSYGHVPRSEKSNGLRRALKLNVTERMGDGKGC